VYLVGGKGDTWRNGKPVREGTEVALDIYDRVGMGDQLMVRYLARYLSRPCLSNDNTYTSHRGSPRPSRPLPRPSTAVPVAGARRRPR